MHYIVIKALWPGKLIIPKGRCFQVSHAISLSKQEDRSAAFAQHSYLNAVSKQVCKNYHSLKTFAEIAAHLFEQPLFDFTLEICISVCG